MGYNTKKTEVLPIRENKHVIQLITNISITAFNSKDHDFLNKYLLHLIFTTIQSATTLKT